MAARQEWTTSRCAALAPIEELTNKEFHDNTGNSGNHTAS
jgi:hypothetical protein